MSGSEINVIDPSIVAISMPRVEIVSAIHLYPSGTAMGPVPRSDKAPPLRQRQLTLTYTSMALVPVIAAHLEGVEPDQPGRSVIGPRSGDEPRGRRQLGEGTCASACTRWASAPAPAL